MYFSFEKQNFTFTVFFNYSKIDTMIRQLWVQAIPIILGSFAVQFGDHLR